MKLTAIDLGRASITDYIEAEPPAVIRRTRPATPEQRKTRRALLARAIERQGSAYRVALTLGISTGSVSNWWKNKSAVPGRFEDKLKELAG